MQKVSKVNSDLLIAIYQNLLTARQSINNIIEKVSDSRLKKELSKQYESYTPIKEQCESYAQKYLIDIVDNSFLEKAKMWMSVNMSILLDKSNRKIASICIIGNTMGLIDLICVISDCQKGKPEFLALAEKLKDLENQNTNDLKPYLLKGSKPKVKAKDSQQTESKVDKDTKTKTENKLDL